jgi:hypothetical protein
MAASPSIHGKIPESTIFAGICLGVALFALAVEEPVDRRIRSVAVTSPRRLLIGPATVDARLARAPRDSQ